MGFAESAAGLGWTLAPPIGGVLYGLGGFSLPFAVFGPLPLVVVFAILAFAPAVEEAALAGGDSREPRPSSNAPLAPAPLRLWRLGTKGLAATTLLATTPFLAWTSFDVYMVIWMRADLRISMTTCTVLFSITPLGYMLATVPAGAVVDKVSCKKKVLCAGGVATGIVYLFWGKWWLSGASKAARVAAVASLQAVSGVVNPFFVVPALPDMHDSHAGTQDEDTTNLISALYTTAVNLGCVLGPALATWGYRTIGFQDTIAAFGALLISASALVYLSCGRSPKRTDGDAQSGGAKSGSRTYSKLHQASDPDDDAGLELAPAPRAAETPAGV